MSELDSIKDMLNDYRNSVKLDFTNDELTEIDNYVSKILNDITPIVELIETIGSNKESLSSIGIAADSITYTLKEGVGPDGLGVDPNTNMELLDLINETQGLLGDYLSHIVGNSTNAYKILPGNEQASPTRRGDSLTLAEEQGSEDVFVEQGTELAAKMNEYSNSRKFNESGTPLSDLIDKTGNTSNFHENLSDIQGRTANKTGDTLINPAEKLTT